jgi:Helix-turn-helix domain
VAGEVHYYTVDEAARVLRLTPERVVQMLEAGEIEGLPPEAGAESGWRIPIHGDVNVAPPPATAIPARPPATPAAELREEPEKPGEPPSTIEEARQPAELPSGDDAAMTPEITSVSGWVSTQQAARALGISARTVRWHIERGKLEARPEGEGVERTWRVSVDSLQAFRDSRRQGQSPRDYRTPATDAEIAAADHGSAIRELADRLVEEARRAEAARVRLELAERAQSSLEAELSEERQRREEAERQRREAEMERDAARRELEALERRSEEPPQTSPRHDQAPTPPAAREAPQTGVQPLSEKSLDTAAAAAGPLRPPEAPQDPPQEVQKRPVPGRRGLLRRIFRR